MGAEWFMCRVNGDDPDEAFVTAVERAAYMNGHGGYTGTIAEKRSYVEIECPDGKKAEEYIEEMCEEDDERVSDKWGPAGCMQVGDGEYCFFGWASS